MIKLLNDHKLIWALLLFFIVIRSNFSIAQSFEVKTYQKINQTNGGFTGNLDNYDSWGIAIDNIGDLDGNGINDLAVGAYTDDDGGTNRGAVYILFLDGNNQVISHTKISDTSGNFLGDLDNDDRFGGSVSYLGDLNSDGLVELAVGADYDGDGGYWHGAVWILSLNSDGTVNNHIKISDTQGGFTGAINGDAIFGTDMENIGDLNNDGTMDLAVGSRRDADGGSRRGAFWVLFMNPDITVNSYQKISDTQGGFLPNLDFEDYFGGSILNFGDQNSDGTNDLIVGAYRDDDLNINSGSFYLIYLNEDGTTKDAVKISNTSGGLSNQISANALFGESIDGVNDIDGDGISEILVGALGHVNPTLGINTGAFYMIELNPDGTVSEDLLYTYGEYCFSGDLSSGDYFGGAITLLEPGPNPKIAVSAYHDSENGPERGAVWILDLGEKTYNVDTFDPSCGMNNGFFIVSGLIPNLDYTITYEYEGIKINDYYLSDPNGTFKVDDLLSGFYGNIIVTESLMECPYDLGSLSLKDDSINPSFNLIEPTFCGATDGLIEINDLQPHTNYTISYTINGLTLSIPLSSDSMGRLAVPGLGAGTYESFEIIDLSSSCRSIPENLFLNDNELYFQSQVINPTACGISDGKIIIYGATPNSTFGISYRLGNTLVNQNYSSNDNGEVFIQNLSSGAYESFTIMDFSYGCTTHLGTIEVIEPKLDIASYFQNPSVCGNTDGQIFFSGLNSNSTYEVSYSVNGEAKSTMALTTDDLGNLELNNLEAGIYSDINITDIINTCQSIVEDIILSEPSFSPKIFADSPTSCISEDGTISISGLLPNTDYRITYEKKSEMTTTYLKSDSVGMLSISSLTIGSYQNFSIVGQDNNCSILVPLIELSCNGELIGCFVTKKFFTPNGDGFNDQWYLDTIDNCQYHVQIFDRYGKLLKSLTPNNPYWDGTYNGEPMPSNDYWYMVLYLEESTHKIFQSHFTLKR